MTHATMTAPTLLRDLRGKLGEGVFSVSEHLDNLRLLVPASRLIELMVELRDGSGYQLTELGGIDYLGYPGRSESNPRFEIHYVLLNHDTSTRLVVKTFATDPDPTVPSVVGLWKGADWMEREVFDMYGIVFDGHPDLRRILMPEAFRSFPLRKDYPLRGRGERHNFDRLTREDS